MVERIVGIVIGGFLTLIASYFGYSLIVSGFDEGFTVSTAIMGFITLIFGLVGLVFLLVGLGVVKGEPRRRGRLSDDGFSTESRTGSSFLSGSDSGGGGMD